LEIASFAFTSLSLWERVGVSAYRDIYKGSLQLDSPETGESSYVSEVEY
jgi:hypothetical protein